MELPIPQIASVRVTVHRTIFPNTKGRSAIADMQLVGGQADGVDPAIGMAVAPIYTWAKAIYEQWIPYAWIVRIVQEAAKNIDSLNWSNSVGPAAVTALSSQRIGWKMSQAKTFVTGEALIHLDEVGPREVKTLAERAAQNWTWKQASKHRTAYAEIHKTPLLAPIKQLLGISASESWSQSAKGWLRSCCADAWNPEIRICPLCESGDTAVWHSCWECPRLGRFRVDNPSLFHCADAQPRRRLSTSPGHPQAAMASCRRTRAGLQRNRLWGRVGSQPEISPHKKVRSSDRWRSNHYAKICNCS